MRFRSFMSGLLSACLLLSTLPARAELVGSAQILAGAEATSKQAQVQSFLARADVQAQMERLGVSPEQAELRVASLTSAELETLSRQIDELPAGAGALELVVIVLLVLIVLELLGAINIFSKI